MSENEDPLPPVNPDRNYLPKNLDFLQIDVPTSVNDLQAIITGMEGQSDTHPVDPSYPTNVWVTHLYEGLTPTRRRQFILVFDVPPEDALRHWRTVRAELVTGAADDVRAARAATIVGAGNELIGYEKMSRSDYVVVFREANTRVETVGDVGRLSWEATSNPERGDWSRLLLALTRESLDRLEIGDPEGFVAGYRALPSPEQKAKYWAELLVAMSKFESSWKPDDVYHESFGVDSIGLLQLSLSDQNNYAVTPRIQNQNQLKDPTINLQWGVAIFARCVSRDRVVASGERNSSRGGARYWSVLRAGHKVELIKELTRKYGL